MNCARSLIGKTASRSLISNHVNIQRTVINPIEPYCCKKKPSGGGGGGESLVFDPELLGILNTIEFNYVKKMAERKYMEIPQDIDTYLNLYYKINLIISTTQNENLKLLFEIARDGLTGALYSRGLYTDVADLTVKNTILEKRIEDILSGKNEQQAMDDTCGEFVITKTFKLAAVYSYYITLYGLPAFGVGFDTNKLTLLVEILRGYGIDPYR
jgi:hypothetical protein